MNQLMRYMIVAVLGGAPALLPGERGPQPPAAEAKPKSDAPPAGRERQGPSREGLRRRVNEWLFEIEGNRRHAEDMLRQLEGGADPSQVREELDRLGVVRPGSGGHGGRGSRPEEGGKGASPGEEGVVVRPLPGDARFKLSPEERGETLKFLDDHVPRAAEAMHELDRSNPEAVTRMLARMRPRVRDITESGKNDAAGAELRIGEFRTSIDVIWARRALDEARKSKDDDAVKARREELRGAIGAHFDSQLAVQEHETDRLAERVQKLRAEVTERRASKDRFVDRELEGVQGRPWGGERSGPREPGRPDSGRADSNAPR